MSPAKKALAVACCASLGLLAGFLLSGPLLGPERKAPSVRETRLQQVKRTGVLRCGYALFPPFIVKDPNSGHIGGPSRDIVEEMGRQLNLKIEWTAEVATGQMLAELALNRVDMICSPVLATPGRARESDFAKPLLYLSMHLYARKDDARFDGQYQKANAPAVRFATLDGQYSAIAAQEDFPAATKVSLPQLSHAFDLFMLVAAKKADLLIMDPHTFADYETAQPGILRPVSGKPLRIIGMGYPLPANEPGLKAMIDTTIAYLHDNGFIEKTLDAYEGSLKALRVAKPYQEPQP